MERVETAGRGSGLESKELERPNSIRTSARSLLKAMSSTLLQTATGTKKIAQGEAGRNSSRNGQFRDGRIAWRELFFPLVAKQGDTSV